MTRVMGQGTFDILHPGHLYYLEESAKLGDELVVVVARDDRVVNDKALLFDQETRRETVEALEVVDRAYAGTAGEIYGILDEVTPDIVTIGHDQPYDLNRIREDLREHGHDHITLERIPAYEPAEGEVVSSSEIKERVESRYGGDLFVDLEE